MRPLIVLALFIIAIIIGIFAYNVSAPSHDTLNGIYAYGGNDLIIRSNSFATYGNAQVTITEIRENNLFEMRSSSDIFPSGRYLYQDGNLIGENTGATFLRKT